MYKFTISFILLFAIAILVKKYKNYYKDDEVELPNEYIVY